MTIAQKTGICSRIAKIRTELFGPRGKAAFAKQLGISPSTYDYYEIDRVPHANILLAIADLAGVDIRWLITGDKASGPALPASHPILRRAAALLADHPDAAAALAAFLDVLAETRKFPSRTASSTRPAGDKQAEAAEPQQPATGDDAVPSDHGAKEQRESWIPILGRSAAGVPHFWDEGSDAKSLPTLGDLIACHGRRTARQLQPAHAEGAALPGLDQAAIEIITLGQADRDNLAEFVASAAIKSRWADAFAVRIDGESMTPDVRHGDLVVLSPSVPAADGRAGLVQLAGQIGVTCKLYRRSGDKVHLVPINEQFAPQTYPAEDVVWALRVLMVIRPG